MFPSLRSRLYSLLILWQALFVHFGVCQWENKQYNPRANPRTVIQTKVARFTVFTDNLIRMEYDPNGIFEDRASTVIVNRFIPDTNTTDFNTTFINNNSTLLIQTKYLTVKYQIGHAFDEHNDSLSIEGQVQNTAFTYVPSGDVFHDNSVSRNLLGTIHSLDTITGAISLNCSEINDVYVWHESLHCAWSVFGRDGYALINDTHSAMIDNRTNWLAMDHQNAIRNKNTQDWYFFGHGLDYRLALKEFALVSGAVPMMPRYMYGSMQCKWFTYSDLQLRQIVHSYQSRALPLDIIIFNMNWHLYGPWGSYTYDPNLFPFPNLTQNYLKQGHNVITSANLHDADGIQTSEEYYKQAAEALNVTNGEGIAFNVTDLAYMQVLEDILLFPVLQQPQNRSASSVITNSRKNDGGKNDAMQMVNNGFDFWWIDWQQGGDTGMDLDLTQNTTVNPTYLLNYMRFADNIRYGYNVRSVVLSRYGGLGNQRYPTGFSGDVNHTWSSLAFQPYFSATASNVAYAWSHDIRGKSYEYELNTRWIQFGAFSAMFRTNGGGDTNCDIWDHPWQYFEFERKALQMRLELLPYIYNTSYALYTQNIQMIRPMYYEYAGLEIAYECPNQYMFGDLMLIAPVTNFSGSYAYTVIGVYGFNLTQQHIWMPSGIYWYEQHSGKYVYSEAGDEKQIERWFDLSEIPIYIRTDTNEPVVVQPFDATKLIGRSNLEFYDHLRWDIYPNPSQLHDKNGSVTLYEDDGVSLNYDRQQVVWTTFEWHFNGNSALFEASVRSVGTYDTFPENRRYSIRIYNVLPPVSDRVFCDGIPLSYNRYAAVMDDSVEQLRVGWFYDGSTMSLTVNCETSYHVLQNETRVGIQFHRNWSTDLLVTAGIRGKIHRASICKTMLNLAYYGPVQAFSLDVISGYATLLTDIGDEYEKVVELVNAFEGVYQNATQQVLSLPVCKGSNANTKCVEYDRWKYCVDLLTMI